MNLSPTFKAATVAALSAFGVAIIDLTTQGMIEDWKQLLALAAWTGIVTFRSYLAKSPKE